jgi:hypothetical protein
MSLHMSIQPHTRMSMRLQLRKWGQATLVQRADKENGHHEDAHLCVFRLPDLDSNKALQINLPSAL